MHRATQIVDELHKLKCRHELFPSFENPSLWIDIHQQYISRGSKSQSLYTFLISGVEARSLVRSCNHRDECRRGIGRSIVWHAETSCQNKIVTNLLNVKISIIKIKYFKFKLLLTHPILT